MPNIAPCVFLAFWLLANGNLSDRMDILISLKGKKKMKPGKCHEFPEKMLHMREKKYTAWLGELPS